MDKRKFFEDFFVALVIGIIFLFIDFKISIGVIIGYIFSIINYKMIEYRYNHLESVDVFTYISIFLSIVVLAFPLLISVLLPNLLSWIGVTIGLMINRSRLMIEAFIKR